MYTPIEIYSSETATHLDFIRLDLSWEILLCNGSVSYCSQSHTTLNLVCHLEVRYKLYGIDRSHGSHSLGWRESALWTCCRMKMVASYRELCMHHVIMQQCYQTYCSRLRRFLSQMLIARRIRNRYHCRKLHTSRMHPWDQPHPWCFTFGQQVRTCGFTQKFFQDCLSTTHWYSYLI